MTRVRLGVSSCLLGHAVRFDGGHKRNVFMIEALAPHVEWVPLCPEVGAGLPTPRPPMRLVTQDGTVRLLTRDNDVDVTALVGSFARRAVERIGDAGLDGYILKKDSPSCGLDRVRVVDTGALRRNGRGIFAATLISAIPYLPVEEEGRLRDPNLREAFFERAFAHHRLSALKMSDATSKDLVRFHSVHKFQLMSHSPSVTRVMGRAVARSGNDPRGTLIRYAHLFRRTLALPVARGRRVNVLHHGIGYLKHALSSSARADLLESVVGYARGEVPLIVPVSLLIHRAKAEGASYLAAQTFLDPYPRSMGLRNAI